MGPLEVGFPCSVISFHRDEIVHVLTVWSTRGCFGLTLLDSE